MYWIVSTFTSLVVQTLSNEGCFGECSRVIARVKLLTKGCVLLNVLLNQLINTQVKHVILDCDIAASCVNLKTLLMIDYNHFS